jgi:hypothetical protein
VQGGPAQLSPFVAPPDTLTGRELRYVITIRALAALL